MRPDEINNPAWDFVKDIPHDSTFARGDRFTPMNYDMDDVRRGGTSLRAYRDGFTSLFAWAIPDPGVLNFLYERIRGCGIVEIGAGNGYWAHLFAQMGADVNAYDTAPMGSEGTWFETRDTPASPDSYVHDRRLTALEEMAQRGYEPKEWHPVKKGGPEALELPENEGRILFLCWPPYSNDMAAECLRRFKGDLVIYVGEGSGGCTADSTFFDMVGHDTYWWGDEDEKPEPADQMFKEIDFHHMVQWSGIHDDLYVFERTPKA